MCQLITSAMRMDLMFATFMACEISSSGEHWSGCAFNSSAKNVKHNWDSLWASKIGLYPCEFFGPV